MAEVEIIYAEASELLAQLVLSEFEQFEIALVKTRDRFMQLLYESPPLMIFFGDSFSIDLEEIIFAVKNLPVIKEIPVIFIGEHDRTSMLPVDMIVQRSGGIDPNTKIRIAKLLYSVREGDLRKRLKQLDMHDDLLKSGFTVKASRDLILDRLYDAYCESELGCLDVTENSMQLVIEKILERITVLLDSEFSFISINPEKDGYEIFYLADMKFEALRESLSLKCRTGVENGKITDREFEKKLTLFTELGSSGPGISGYFIAGCINSEHTGMTGIETENISNQIKKLIHLASVFEKKELDTSILYTAFSRFLPQEIINDLLIKDTEADLMTGEKRTIVALFSHIRNFDWIMENNSPDDVVNFLNQHFTNMVGIIKKHGGSVDKFIGDAVYAIFGAPISYIDNAERAATAALEMVREYDNIDLSGIRLPVEGFSIGVGLNEGPAIIGNIGCSDKFDYTAIGDTINLAARLESLTKHYKTPVLVSEKVKDGISSDFTARLVDIARVKGKSKPTRIYSLELEPEYSSEKWFDLYSKGIKMYCIGNWYTAEKYLEEADNLIPDDFPTRQFINRCRKFAVDPPENWDGSTTLDFK